MCPDPRRFQAPGTITNYQLAGVRGCGVWRGVRWLHVWASLSNEFHPRSESEALTMQQDFDDDPERP